MSASSTAKPLLSLLLIAASLLLALSGCNRNSTRPAPALPPPPPEVRCAPAPTPVPPPIPDCTTILSWDCVALMDDWAVAVLGLFEAEAVKGQASRTCEQGHRDKGVIR